MGRLFGTDGIRGVANVELRPSLASLLGRAERQLRRRLAVAGTLIRIDRSITRGPR